MISKGSCRFIKHDRQHGIFEHDNGEKYRYQLKELLFENFKRKGKNKNGTSKEIEEFLKVLKDENIFATNISDEAIDELKSANMELMKRLYDCSSDSGSFYGENNLDHGKVTRIGESSYNSFIPPHCKFRQGNVADIERYLPHQTKFDFIVIDPPWSNRFVKRSRKRSSRGYHTMTNDDIQNLPIEHYTKESTIVVIWCTNSETHIRSLQEKFLVKWKLKLLTTWKWFKVSCLSRC